MNSITLRNLLFVLAIAVIGVACSDSSTSPNTEPAVVEGQVENTNSGSQKAKSVEGAVVTAAQVNANGELETIGNAETTTNAEGEFTLEIDGSVAADIDNNVVIVVDNNGEMAKTFVTAKVEGGSKVAVQPITFESSAETEVYQEIVANGDANVVAKADIEANVTAKVAQDIESNSQNAVKLAAALAAQAEARAKFYSDKGTEISEEQQENIQEAKFNAQITLESRLNAATTVEEKQAAVDTFLKAMAKAELDAEVSAAVVAKASEFSSRVLLKHSTDLSAEAQADLRKHASYMATFAMETAIEAQMKAVGAAESSVNSAVDAAVSLRADIKAMSNTTQEDIDSAFASFNSEVVTIMENDINVSGSLFADANATINESSGAKVTFEAALEGALDLAIIMDTYSAFYTEIDAIVESTFSAASETEAEAYADLLILINVAS